MSHHTPHRAGRRAPALLALATALTTALTTGLAALSVVPAASAPGTSSRAAATATPHARPTPERARRALDGRLAFVRDGQVFSMTRWGGDVRQLTTRGTNSHPQFSPDGRRIAYLHEAGGRRDIWVMASDGGRQRAVTTSGDVSSDGASWAPGGERLAYADALGELVFIGAGTSPGAPQVAQSFATGGYCDLGDTGEREPVPVVGDLSWSAHGVIAVVNHGDCYFDDRFDLYDVATQERSQYDASGADCCGYREWSDLFWGPTGQLGYTLLDRGDLGDLPAQPPHIVYPGFRSLDGDTGGTASPSGAFLALSRVRGGVEVVVRARADGFGRTVLVRGAQPDWQLRPR